jgi:YD repeat-containing protein
MLAYVYADGKRDTYVYDSAWRVKIFYDRDGRATHFRYNSDGTMNTTHDSDSPKAK